jgi:hypothetical protein
VKKLLTLLLLSSVVAVAARAEVTERQRQIIEQKMAGTYNPLAFADGKLVLDVQERLRLEVRDDNFDFNDAVNVATDDAYLLQRIRLGLLFKPTGWLKAYLQGQDSRELGSERDNVPFVAGAEGDDPFDLRQAYVELSNPSETPWGLKLGRQELSYGDERLIGAFEWNNFARTFDAVKLRYDSKPDKVWVDTFAARVVNIHDFGPTGNYGFEFNDSDGNDNFVGLYAGTTKLPFQTTEAYFLYRDKDDSNPRYVDNATPTANAARAYDIQQEVYTVGLRAKSKPGTFGGVDYEAEGAYQWGRDAGRVGTAYPNATGTMLDHSAFAAMARLGYTWADCAWKPRLGVEYSVASGDENPNDGDDDSFLNLFPTNHKFYGYMDMFSWKNIHNPSVQLKFTPYQDKTVAWRNLWIQLDYHAFWLYTNEDAWYRANGVATVRAVNAAARAADTFVGSEIDLTIGHAPMKWVRVLAGYSRFFRGDYLQATGADDDANFGYLQTVITF